jgi:hypothetical protein
MKLKNLQQVSTKASRLVSGSQEVTDLLLAGWDIRFDYLELPPLLDPVTVNLPGCTIRVQNGAKSSVKWPVAGTFSE